MNRNKITVIKGDEEIEVQVSDNIFDILSEVIKIENGKKDKRIYKKDFIESDLFGLMISKKNQVSK